MQRAAASVEGAAGGQQRALQAERARLLVERAAVQAGLAAGQLRAGQLHRDRGQRAGEATAAVERPVAAGAHQLAVQLAAGQLQCAAVLRGAVQAGLGAVQQEAAAGANDRAAVTAGLIAAEVERRQLQLAGEHGHGATVQLGPVAVEGGRGVDAHRGAVEQRESAAVLRGSVAVEARGHQQRRAAEHVERAAVLRAASLQERLPQLELAGTGARVHEEGAAVTRRTAAGEAALGELRVAAVVLQRQRAAVLRARAGHHQIATEERGAQREGEVTAALRRSVVAQLRTAQIDQRRGADRLDGAAAAHLRHVAVEHALDQRGVAADAMRVQGATAAVLRHVAVEETVVRLEQRLLVPESAAALRGRVVVELAAVQVGLTAAALCDRAAVQRHVVAEDARRAQREHAAHVRDRALAGGRQRVGTAAAQLHVAQLDGAALHVEGVAFVVGAVALEARVGRERGVVATQVGAAAVMRGVIAHQAAVDEARLARVHVHAGAVDRSAAAEARAHKLHLRLRAVQVETAAQLRGRAALERAVLQVQPGVGGSEQCAAVLGGRVEVAHGAPQVQRAGQLVDGTAAQRAVRLHARVVEQREAALQVAAAAQLVGDVAAQRRLSRQLQTTAGLHVEAGAVSGGAPTAHRRQVRERRKAVCHVHCAAVLRAAVGQLGAVAREAGLRRGAAHVNAAALARRADAALLDARAAAHLQLALVQVEGAATLHGVATLHRRGGAQLHAALIDVGGPAKVRGGVALHQLRTGERGRGTATQIESGAGARSAGAHFRRRAQRQHTCGRAVHTAAESTRRVAVLHRGAARHAERGGATLQVETATVRGRRTGAHGRARLQRDRGGRRQRVQTSSVRRAAGLDAGRRGEARLASGQVHAATVPGGDAIGENGAVVQRHLRGGTLAVDAAAVGGSAVVDASPVAHQHRRVGPHTATVTAGDRRIAELGTDVLNGERAGIDVHPAAVQLSCAGAERAARLDRH
mmetsp:Transcript_2186/g.6883  ORF Transcript_2186/g.6883 Transcript_2186/m.6883 type:complete len:981 (+) Transcript_2186:5385-8327(+)